MASRSAAPKGFTKKEDRDKLGKVLYLEISASKRALGNLPLRWKKNEAIDNCDPYAVKTDVVEGAETYPMPLWTQRADRIAGSVYDGITGLDPWVQAIADDPQGSDLADKVEHDLHFLAVQSKLGPRLYRALRLACNTNIAIIRCVPVPAKGVFDFLEVHPQDFCAYPAEIDNLYDLKTVATRSEKMKWEIVSKINDGTYFDAKLTAPDADTDDTGFDRAGRDDRFDKTDRTQNADEDAGRFQLYDFITHFIDGDKVRLLRGVLCYSTKEILDLEDFNFEHPWFTDLRYDPEYGRFWPAGSPAQRIQGIQIAFTDDVNTILQGGRWAAVPIMYTRGGGSLEIKTRIVNPGDLLELPANTEIGAVPNAFNGNFLVQLLPLFEKLADGVTRISAVGTGQQAMGSRTATEIGAVVEGQKQGEGMYLSMIADSIETCLYPQMYEMYKFHFQDYKTRWGNTLQIETVDEIQDLQLRFEVTGRSGSNNPSTIAQKLMMLLQLLQSPNSKLDPAAVEAAIVNALQIPGSAKLFKPDDPAHEIALAVLDAVKAGMDPNTIVTTVQRAILMIAEAEQNAQQQPGSNQGQMGAPSAVPQAPGGPTTPPTMASQGPPGY